MRITDVEVTELRVPGWQAESFDGSYDTCVIRVHTDAGISGLAETDSLPGVIRAIVEARPSHTGARGLRELLVGQDPSDIEGLWQRMYDGTSYIGRRGVVIHAISAIDIALWDLKGKAENKTVAELLGTPKRDRMLAYGTVYPLGKTPDEVRKNIDRGLDRGLRAIKIVADPHWHEDVARSERLIRTAREHVGEEVMLMCDAATAWSRAEEGLPLLPVFKDCGFAWLEAPLPVDDIEGHARFSGQGIPIGGGDLGLTTCYEYREMLDAGRIDIAQPDITMLGGLTELRRLCEEVRTRGRRLVPHGYKTNITLAMNLNFLAQHWTEEPLEYSTSESPLRWTLCRERFEVDGDGKVARPQGPGLGVELDPEALARFAVD
ncbi:MAG: mandelate racemase/muconate lactonizing enzyme family protein [Rhodovibrionaceae bacterium]